MKAKITNGVIEGYDDKALEIKKRKIKCNWCDKHMILKPDKKGNMFYWCNCGHVKRRGTQ